jgi:magnesium transporter
MNVQSINYQGLYFINVAKPTDFEMKFLKNTYNFDSLILEDYLHKTQIPKIENHKNYNLMVFRFPIFSDNVPQNSHQFPLFGENPSQNPHQHEAHSPIVYAHSKKRRLTSSYVNFFISNEYVVVLHEGTLPKIDEIFSLCQRTLHNRTEYMGKGTAYLAYKIIDALTDDCFPAVNELTATIDRVDKALEEKQSQKTLEEISTIRRNLVVFHTMIKPILPLLKELKEGKHVELNGTMRPFWGNVLDHMQKVWDRVEDNGELIEGISRSNESLLMTQTNIALRVLTVITVIILPLQVLGGFYGMNVEGLPFTKGPWVFEIHIGMILSIVIPLIIIFKLKRWI